jgi:oligopeptide/dipeptide ABC transporter ATP-binding protein
MTVSQSRAAAVDGGTDETLLEVRDLVTEFETPEGTVRAVDGVSFTVGPGETLGLVGESGSGKSVTAMSIMGLVQHTGGEVRSGQALFEGRDLVAMTDAELDGVRGEDIAMIFQDPITSLNPVMSVGQQITEAVLTHHPVPEAEARDRAIELLDSVGVPDAARRVDQFPHEYSGGMRQRVMIAIAMANRPKLLIADEPTTALDVTVQAQVLEVLAEARDQLGASTILITHDLGLLAELADRVVVMYAGRVVETGTVHEIFAEPRHPYTRGLLASRPGLDTDDDRLPAIPGQAPSLLAPPAGCRFHPRCDLSNGRELCRDEEPALRVIRGGETERASRCHFHEELAGSADRPVPPAGDAPEEERR